jgi:hypothetical protein
MLNNFANLTHEISLHVIFLIKGFSLAVSGGQLHTEAVGGGMCLENFVIAASFWRIKQFVICNSFLLK